MDGRSWERDAPQQSPAVAEVEPQWEALGLEEMHSDSEGEVRYSGGSSDDESFLLGGGGQESSSEFRTDVSDTGRNTAWKMASSGSGGSEFSTDVSNTRGKYWRHAQ